MLEKSINQQAEEKVAGVSYLVRACFLYGLKLSERGSAKVINYAENFMLHEFANLSVLQKFEIFGTFFNK